MIIEARKYYKNRFGAKILVVGLDLNNEWVCQHLNDSREAYWVNINGKFKDDYTDSELDLISEWKEPKAIEGWINIYVFDASIRKSMSNFDKEENTEYFIGNVSKNKKATEVTSSIEEYYNGRKRLFVRKIRIAEDGKIEDITEENDEKTE